MSDVIEVTVSPAEALRLDLDVLALDLALWAARDDSKAQPEARQSADTAMRAIDRTPGFRCLALLLLPPIPGFALAMAWVAETGWFVGLGTMTGIVLATVYAAYRILGGGNYNTRRRGSPWRNDHRDSR